MSEWISVKDQLPEIDYANRKSSLSLKIKINNNESFAIKCSYREVFITNERGDLIRKGWIFYDREKGREYYGVTHWMPLPTRQDNK